MILFYNPKSVCSTRKDISLFDNFFCKLRKYEDSVKMYLIIQCTYLVLFFFFRLNFFIQSENYTQDKPLKKSSNFSFLRTKNEWQYERSDSKETWFIYLWIFDLESDSQFILFEFSFCKNSKSIFFAIVSSYVFLHLEKFSH